MALRLVQKPDIIHPLGNRKNLIFVEDNLSNVDGTHNALRITFANAAAVPTKSWVFTWGLKTYTLNFIAAIATLAEDYRMTGLGIFDFNQMNLIADRLRHSPIADDFTIEAFEADYLGTMVRGIELTRKVRLAGEDLTFSITAGVPGDIVGTISTAGVTEVNVENYKVYVKILVEQNGKYEQAHTLSASGITDIDTGLTTIVISDVITLLKKYISILPPADWYGPMSIDELSKNYKIVYWSECDLSGTHYISVPEYMEDLLTPSTVIMCGSSTLDARNLHDNGYTPLWEDVALTNKPITQAELVNKLQPYWLAVYKTADFNVEVTEYEAGGATGPAVVQHVISTAYGFENGKIVYIPIHPWLRLNANPNIIKLEWAFPFGTKAMNIDIRYHRNNRFYLYLNSRGGVDTFWNKGIKDTSVVTVDVSSDISIDPYDVPEVGTFESIAKTHGERAKINSGFYARSEIPYMKEFVAAGNIWEWIEFPVEIHYRTKYKAVEILSNKFEMQQDDQRLYQFKWEYQYRFEDRYISNLEVDEIYTDEEFSLYLEENGNLDILLTDCASAVLYRNGHVIDSVIGAGAYSYSGTFFKGDLITVKARKVSGVIQLTTATITRIRIVHWKTKRLEQLYLYFLETDTTYLAKNLEQFRRFLNTFHVTGMNDQIMAINLIGGFNKLINEKVAGVGIPIPMVLLTVSGSYATWAGDPMLAAIKLNLTNNITSVTIN